MIRNRVGIFLCQITVPLDDDDHHIHCHRYHHHLHHHYHHRFMIATHILFQRVFHDIPQVSQNFKTKQWGLRNRS